MTIEEVEKMTHEEMARLWRFGQPGTLISGEPATERFMEKWRELGGMNPELSKKIGWEPPCPNNTPS